MDFQTEKVAARGVKITLKEGGKECARAFLYVLKNDLHDKPFGFLEDVNISEELRGQGIGSKLIQAVINEAKKQGCYKLIGTSRHAREKVHKFYEKLGFNNYGVEFRMDLAN